MLETFNRIFNAPLANLFKTVLLIAALIGVIIYFSNAGASHDLEWYLTGFNELPTRLVVYSGDQQTELKPGDPGYDSLAEAVRASLNSGIAANSGTGLSPVSLDDAYHRYVSLEVFFDHPVKLHAWFFTGDPTQMLFPITGRHSDWPIVFMGQDSEYLSGAPVLKTKDPILQVLRELGYLN